MFVKSNKTYLFEDVPSSKIIDKDSQKQTRWIREAIWIRKRGDLFCVQTAC